MALRFVDLYRGDANRYSRLPPFDCAIAYANEHWWDRPSAYGDPLYVQVQVRVCAAEVARVELDDPGGINPEYLGVSKLGLERLGLPRVN